MPLQSCRPLENGANGENIFGLVNTMQLSASLAEEGELDLLVPLGKTINSEPHKDAEREADEDYWDRTVVAINTSQPILEGW